MKRRNFITALALGTTASALMPAQAASTKRLLVHKTRLHGMAYYQAEQALDNMQIGQPVQLKREPHNPHDSHAIEVYWQNYKLGYVPRISNFALAKMLDEQAHISAFIVALNPQEMPCYGVDIEVYWHSEA